MPSFLRYDAANMKLVAKGVTIAELENAKKTVLSDWKSGTQDWLGTPDDRETLKRVVTLAKEKKRFKTCLVIGIGGSDLGARAAYHALKHEAKGMRLEFLGGNTDPDEIEWMLKSLNLKTTLVNVISKSGDTVEPMSVFLLVREQLIKAVGEKSHAEHIVATTDEQSGSLHDLAAQNGYATLPVPSNIGGRFSVLTPVGLFPLACAGINIEQMLDGAGAVREAFVSESPKQNDACRYASLHVSGEKNGHHIHVLMPYSERLRVFGAWYRQIWAESLGKEGKGPTPIAALGATDQHSQIQLYNEGPDNKLVTFIEVERFSSTLAVPSSVKQIVPLAYLSNISFETIIHAERAGTAGSLTKNKRANGTIFLEWIDARSLGGLFLFFEIATGLAGALMGVNAYNQPGVESGKKLMRDLLKRGTL